MKNATTNPLTVSAETVTNPLTVSEIVKALTVYIMSSIEHEQIPVRMRLDIDENRLTEYPSYTIRIASESAYYGTEKDYENRLEIIDTVLRAARLHSENHEYMTSFRAYGVCSWEFIAETESALLGFIWLEWCTKSDIEKAGENK